MIHKIINIDKDGLLPKEVPPWQEPPDFRTPLYRAELINKINAWYENKFKGKSGYAKVSIFDLIADFIFSEYFIKPDDANAELRKLGVKIDMDELVLTIKTTNISIEGQLALDSGKAVVICMKDIFEIAKAISSHPKILKMVRCE